MKVKIETVSKQHIESSMQNKFFVFAFASTCALFLSSMDLAISDHSISFLLIKLKK